MLWLWLWLWLWLLATRYSLLALCSSCVLVAVSPSPGRWVPGIGIVQVSALITTLVRPGDSASTGGGKRGNLSSTAPHPGGGRWRKPPPHPLRPHANANRTRRKAVAVPSHRRNGHQPGWDCHAACLPTAARGCHHHGRRGGAAAQRSVGAGRIRRCLLESTHPKPYLSLFISCARV